MSIDITEQRAIAVTINGEPADHRTLELLERGIEALKAQWDAAYTTITNEMPSAGPDYIPKVTFDHIIAHGDELIRLSNDLYDAKAAIAKQAAYGKRIAVFNATSEDIAKQAES